MKNNTSALILFGKFPTPGKVKTRLAEHTGNADAAQFYKLCVENIFDKVGKLPQGIDTFFFYSDMLEEGKVRNWVPIDIECEANSQSELIEVIKQDFYKLFKRGYKRVVIISTDIPDVSEELLLSAFKYLESHDITIGSDNDGGYYLLGMRNYFESIFDITYGKGLGTFDQTLERARVLNLSNRIITTLTDVDTFDDLTRWCSDTKMLSTHPLKYFVQKMISRYSIVK